MTPIVLFGGPSDERHVSVASAQNIARMLPEALLWYWAPEGAVYDVSAKELLAHEDPFETDYVPSRPAIWPDMEQALDTLPVDDPLFILGVHGTAGEDGTLQRMLEERSLPFTGSGSDASANAFHKERAKAIVRDRVRTAESRVAHDSAELAQYAGEMLEKYERIVAKPVAGGSSRGLFFLKRGDAIPPIGVPYIVEQFIAGRELTVGVVDMGDGPFALPVIEIEVDPGFEFNYAGKYHGTGTREICPAKIPDALRDEAQRVAVTAHEALGCHGYSRTDLIAGDDGVYFLEVNTLPGLTKSSLVPQQLRTAGIDMRAFLEKQMELATAVSRGAPAR
ncbi:MAG TPA: ATP-grasp domain-containing protein [Thermoanaerobaculia bacterium]|nr:ATP-grasp domain-containing protein [Thermoanaerobaculia bacterium]